MFWQEESEITNRINFFPYNEWHEVITLEQKTDQMTLQWSSKGNSKYHTKFCSVMLKSGTGCTISSTENRTTSKVCFVHEAKSGYDGATNHSDWTKKCRQAGFIPVLKHSSSIPVIYALQEFTVMRTEDESGVKTGDSNEKRLILFTLEKEMTRFNETRFSVVEE